MAVKHLTITNVQGAGSVRATFKTAEQPPQFFPWNFTAEAGGAIDPAGVQQIAQGADIFVTITPDNGMELDKVFVDTGGGEVEVPTDD